MKQQRSREMKTETMEAIYHTYLNHEQKGKTNAILKAYSSIIEDERRDLAVYFCNILRYRNIQLDTIPVKLVFWDDEIELQKDLLYEDIAMFLWYCSQYEKKRT